MKKKLLILALATSISYAMKKEPSDDGKGIIRKGGSYASPERSGRFVHYNEITGTVRNESTIKQDERSGSVEKKRPMEKKEKRRSLDLTHFKSALASLVGDTEEKLEKKVERAELTDNPLEKERLCKQVLDSHVRNPSPAKQHAAKIMIDEWRREAKVQAINLPMLHKVNREEAIAAESRLEKLYYEVRKELIVQYGEQFPESAYFHIQKCADNDERLTEIKENWNKAKEEIDAQGF